MNWGMTGCGLDVSHLRLGPAGCSCERGNKLPILLNLKRGIWLFQRILDTK
jgi:hypothetical protein